MVVPAVRVVIKNHNCGIGPLWPVLEKIDRVHDERLLVQRIGISRVSVLEASSFQETDCGKITGGYCVKEIVDVVLILGNGVEWLSNCRYRGGTCMSRVRGRCIVLERLMVRNVINLFYSGDRGGRAALASRAAVRVRDRQVKSAFEEAPSHAGGIKQVADIRPAHLDLIRGRADVTQRIRVVDDCG